MGEGPHIAPYSGRARAFFDQYRSIRFEDAHGHWLHCLPAPPGHALDVGAGSGRDANALAARGWRVTAAEPAPPLRRLAEAASPAGQAIVWADSALPELGGVTAPGEGFALILLSAVWMHLAPDQRPGALRRLVGLLAPRGVVVVTLRHGPATDDRAFHPCDRATLKALAREQGLAVAFEHRTDDQLGRDAVRWETVVLARP